MNNKHLGVSHSLAIITLPSAYPLSESISAYNTVVPHNNGRYQPWKALMLLQFSVKDYGIRFLPPSGLQVSYTPAFQQQKHHTELMLRQGETMVTYQIELEQQH